MNNFPSEVKQTLDNIINDMAKAAWLYSTRPGHSFTRTGKLGFAKTMSLIIAMEGGTLSEEMMEYFNYDLSAWDKAHNFTCAFLFVKYITKHSRHF